MLMKKILLFALLAIGLSAFKTPVNDEVADNTCSEDFAVYPDYGRDCVAFYVAGPDISNFTFVAYTITFDDNTTTTFKVLDSSEGFKTGYFGYNCNFKWATVACAKGRYQCDETFVYSQEVCLIL
jgi:hypothetical protein